MVSSPLLPVDGCSSAHADAHQIVVEVRDQGLGIEAADLPHIFEPFRRSEAVVRMQIPGVGLGLSATRRIVEAHGGRIEVESHPGLGTTFRLYLPLMQAADRAPSPDGARLTGPPGASPPSAH